MASFLSNSKFLSLERDLKDIKTNLGITDTYGDGDNPTVCKFCMQICFAHLPTSISHESWGEKWEPFLLGSLSEQNSHTYYANHSYTQSYIFTFLVHILEKISFGHSSKNDSAYGIFFGCSSLWLTGLLQKNVERAKISMTGGDIW